MYNWCTALFLWSVPHLVPQSVYLGYFYFALQSPLITLGLSMKLRGGLSLMYDICSVPSVGASVNWCRNSLRLTSCLIFTFASQGFICFIPAKFSITAHCWFPTPQFLVPNPYPFQVPTAGTTGTAWKMTAAEGEMFFNKTSGKERSQQRRHHYIYEIK